MIRVVGRFVHTRLEEVEACVVEVLRSFGKVEPQKISKSASLLELGLDSLDKVDLVLDLEDKFSVRILPDEMLKIQTVLDAITIFYKYK